MAKERTEFSTSGFYKIKDDKDLSGKIDNQNSNMLISPAKIPIGSNDMSLHDHTLGQLTGINSNTINTFQAENMEVPGTLTVGQDVRIKGHIQADEITIDVRKIILNMDYGYVEEVFSKMQLHQLNQLLTHLDDLKLMIEKEKFKRS